MKLALIGYGKMGQLLERLAAQGGHEVVSTIDPHIKDAKYCSIDSDSISAADVVIDFSHPTCILDNIHTIAQLGKNMVIGTTGWYDHLDEVKKTISHNNVGAIWAANFSIGVTLFQRVVAYAAELINDFESYDIAGQEVHHHQKADSPSGTAETLAKTLLSKISRKTEALYNTPNSSIAPHQLHFSSTRCGNIPGTHQVMFDSTADTITLTHQARSREGFALGALEAASWIHNKTGFYSIEEMI